MSPEQVLFVILAGIGLVVLVWWLWTLQALMESIAGGVAAILDRLAALEGTQNRLAAQIESRKGDPDWRAPARVIS